jgi:putative phage-type endonuclease
MPAKAKKQKLAPINYEDRRTYIGSSDVGTIFGVNPWKSRLELYEEKTGLIAPTYSTEQEKRLRRGKFLEPWALKMLEEEKNIFAVKHNQRYVDEECAWMSCEVDFEFMADDGLQNGEIKTVNVFAARDWGLENSDEIPLSYALQAHYGLMVAPGKRQRTLVVALIGADDLRCYEVWRDEELHAAIRRKVLEFWMCVQTRTPPPPVTADDMNRVLARMDGYVVLGDESVWNKIAELKKLKAQIKECNEKKEEIETEIKRYVYLNAAADADPKVKTWIIHGADGNKLLTVAQRHRSGYTVDATDYIECRLAGGNNARSNRNT